MPLRKLVPLIAAALTLAACSSDSITGPGAQRKPPRLDDGGGMLGGGGVMRPDLATDGGGMLGGGG
ncbi:MAG TPA: hypothetical protein VFJ82_14415 [Longimicrobium sp.]|nr:hypothetical protein [Longimicrobium sp.]